MTLCANAPMNFQTTHNVRELGGYTGENGIILNTHKLLRGGDLSGLTPNELKQLKDYGIHVCIDLRHDAEKSVPDPYEDKDGLRYYAIPMAGSPNDISFSKKPEELLYHLYIHILNHYQSALLEELRIIASEDDGIIFHCTAGKDRTGLTAMLILSLCGVSDAQIIADYEASEKNNAKQIRAQKQALKTSGMTHVPFEIFQSNPKTMEKTLTYLKEHYGSVTGYLKAIGLTEAQAEAIRKKMLSKTCASAGK